MTALPGAMPASVVDQYASHYLRCGAKEVSPISPIDLTLVDQPQVDLVNERRWLQRVTLALAFELTAGDAAELDIDNRSNSLRAVRLPRLQSPRSAVTSGGEAIGWARMTG
jgi:hypothetical protein